GPGASRSVTSWQQIGATTRLEVTCTLSNVSFLAPATYLRSYSGGNYNSLQQLYRVGLQGPDDQLVAGIMAHRANFRVACDSSRIATYSSPAFTGAPVTTTPVTLPGLVIADNEATSFA